MAYALERCKANGGAAGMDNQTFEDIEQHGLERWLSERICSGIPCSIIASASTSITFWLFSLRRGWIARHSSAKNYLRRDRCCSLRMRIICAGLKSRGAELGKGHRRCRMLGSRKCLLRAVFSMRLH